MDYRETFREIIRSDREIEFEFLGLNLLLSRLVDTYKSNPSPKIMEEALDEVNAFVGKYERILKNELKTLSGEKNADKF